MKNIFAIFAAILACTALLPAQTLPNAVSPQDITSLLKSPTNAGTEFFFSFPPCYEEESAGYENSCRVFVTSPVKQLITVEVPGKSWKMTKVAIANDAIEFVIPTGVAQPFIKKGSSRAPAEQVYKGGAIHVAAKHPIICYGVTRYNYTSDGFLAVPVSSMGTEYIVAAWPQYTAIGSYQLVALTAISAAYDETVVQFTMGGNNASQTSGGLKPGESTTFNMDKGDVLCFASDGDIQDVSGSRIRATKPIGVTSGNQCANVPGGVPWCDYTSEMELPTYSWGKEYHVTPIFARKKNSYIRIFAKEPNTTVYRDGIQWLTLTKTNGKIDTGYVERRADTVNPRAIVITADKPIYVVQYNTGQADDNVSSDPFQMVLTPFEQYQKEVVFCTPGAKTSNNNFKLHYINLVYQLTDSNSVPDDLEFAVIVNGKYEWKKISTRFGGTPGMIFSVPINGNKYACKQITLPGDGVYSIRANSPIAAYSYGFSNYDSYGFPSSVGLSQRFLEDTLAPVVTGTQNCDGSVLDGMVKDYLDTTIARTNFGLIYMDLNADSSYNYTFEYDRNHTLVSGETRETDWMLTVIDSSKVARAVLWFIDRNGNYATSVYTYTPTKPTLTSKDNSYFGLVKPGQVISNKFTFTNQTQNNLTITTLKLKSGNNGFLIESVSLPFMMKPGESREITIRFQQSKVGIFIDTLGLGDSCTMIYPLDIMAMVSSPILDVIDHDFNTQIIQSQTSWFELFVKNIGKVDIILTGDDHITALQASPEFKAVDWKITYPLNLHPGGTISFQVDYLPTKKGTSTARITFSSDATTLDSVCVLTGTAIDTSTVGVEGEISTAPFTLNVSPNPIGTNGGVVEYTMQSHGYAELTLHSSIGEHIVSLAKSEYDKGSYQVRIPIELLSSGRYIVRMVVGNFSVEKSVVIVK
ncbi:MAG: IgGFc-binding protein [Ignavibacteria bacterium]|nr:IgGFc-binding protein [Ignavibacteria bacterium]